MKKAFRVFAFEWRRFFKDLPRCLIFGLCLLFVFLIAMYFAYFRMGISSGGAGYENPPTIWSAELAAEYALRRDSFYHQYLIAIGEEMPKEGEIYVYMDPAYLWKHYQYYDMLLKTQTPSIIGGFSDSSLPFFPLSARYESYCYLSAYRMFLYQDVAYIFFLAPFWLHIYFVCRYDASINTDRLFASVGVSKSETIAGRLIHCIAFFLLAWVVLALLGFIFYQNVPYASYDGQSWHLSSSLAVYFERWAEMGLSLLSILCVMFALMVVIPNGKVDVVLGLILAFSLTPSLYFLREALFNLQSFPSLFPIPFLNLVASDGFSDSMGIQKYWGPITLLVLSGVILSAFSLVHRRKPLDSKKAELAQ